MTEEIKEEVVVATEEPQAKNGLDKFFGITRSGSTMRTEIVAGLTTFMAMVYILLVNAGMFSTFYPLPGNPSFGAAYIATAVGAIVGTLLMAFLAKMPLAQASGMGINAFLVFTLMEISGLSYANCMVFTLLDGVIFLVLTVTGLRKQIFEAIPAAVRHAIPVGIGLFIAFIGMQNAGVIVNENSTLVTFVNLNVLNADFVTNNDGTIGGMLPAIVALLGVIAIAIMDKKQVKGAILWGILGSAVLYFAALGIAAACGNEVATGIFSGISLSNPFEAFGDWATMSFGKVFTDGFNFDQYLGLPGNDVTSLIMVLVTSALSLCMIDMFDTIGTCYGACAKGGLLDEEGTPLNMNKMMLADAIATCTGAIAGTSTVTTFVESASGVAAGGKTGMTALTTAILFALAMFLSPIAQIIPSCATSTALIYVGVLMMTNVVKIDWTDAAESIVGFLTLAIMVLGYSISTGIGMGMIAYVLVMICTGKIKEIKVATWVVSAFFLATFLLT